MTHKDYCERCDRIHASIDCPPAPRAEPYTDESPADIARVALKRIADSKDLLGATSSGDWIKRAKIIAEAALKAMG
jgi:hypothetical protein